MELTIEGLIKEAQDGAKAKFANKVHAELHSDEMTKLAEHSPLVKLAMDSSFAGFRTRYFEKTAAPGVGGLMGWLGKEGVKRIGIGAGIGAVGGAIANKDDMMGGALKGGILGGAAGAGYHQFQGMKSGVRGFQSAFANKAATPEWAAAKATEGSLHQATTRLGAVARNAGHIKDRGVNTMSKQLREFSEVVKTHGADSPQARAILHGNISAETANPLFKGVVGQNGLLGQLDRAKITHNLGAAPTPKTWNPTTWFKRSGVSKSETKRISEAFGESNLNRAQGRAANLEKDVAGWRDQGRHQEGVARLKDASNSLDASEKTLASSVPVAPVKEVLKKGKGEKTPDFLARGAKVDTQHVADLAAHGTKVKAFGELEKTHEGLLQEYANQSRAMKGAFPVPPDPYRPLTGRKLIDASPFPAL